MSSVLWLSIACLSGAASVSNSSAFRVEENVAANVGAQLPFASASWPVWPSGKVDHRLMLTWRERGDDFSGTRLTLLEGRLWGSPSPWLDITAAELRWFAKPRGGGWVGPLGTHGFGLKLGRLELVSGRQLVDVGEAMGFVTLGDALGPASAVLGGGVGGELDWGAALWAVRPCARFAATWRWGESEWSLDERRYELSVDLRVAVLAYLKQPSDRPLVAERLSLDVGYGYRLGGAAAHTQWWLVAQANAMWRNDLPSLRSPLSVGATAGVRLEVGG